MPLPLPRPDNPGLILVIDDEPRNIQVVGSLLLREGHEIIAATSGEEALHKLRGAHPDLILLDLMMPGMSGIEFCHKLRELPISDDLAVIFLTAATEKSLVIEAIEAGAIDFITKPFHGPELVSRVRAQLQLLHTRRRLASTIDERDRLLEVVAHDLKNPLGAIRFAASLALESSTSLNPHTTQLLHAISHSADTALESIQNLLHTRRYEEITRAPNRRATPLGTCLQTAVGSFIHQAQAKNLTLSLHIPPADPEVWADPRALRSAIENLISNAIKYSPDHTTITLSILTNPTSASLRVEDQGPGIPEQDLPDLFRRYSQLSSRPTAGETSSGLGLSIARSLIETMNGSLDYQSSPLGGACFILELPLAPPRPIDNNLTS